LRIGGRAINAEKRLLYIITPLHVQQLQRVDVLVRGRGLEVPSTVRFFFLALSRALSRPLSLSRARALSPLSLSPPSPFSLALSRARALSISHALALSLSLSLSLSLTPVRARLACCSSVSIAASAHQRIETSVLCQSFASIVGLFCLFSRSLLPLTSVLCQSAAREQ
jgi:hypothetical protein